MHDHDHIAPGTPVLVGVGLVSQRQENPLRAAEPLALMIEATRRASADAGLSSLGCVRRIYVPRGRWRYGDPGRLVGRAVGAADAHTVLARVGVLQQTLIAEACRSIADDCIGAALVVGGEAGYRLLRGKITGTEIRDTPDEGIPDETWKPAAPLVSSAELAAGLSSAVGLYALIESALRHARGESLAANRDRISEMYARFSRIAADNDEAWSRVPLDATAIRDPSEKNAMLAFPYTKRHCSAWSVDQASALLLMSARLAAELAVPRDRWVFPLSSSESNHMETVSGRAIIHRAHGARLTGRSALGTAGLTVDDVTHFDLYSCFPSAVEICAMELSIPVDRDKTITGGMAYAGGPFNNYVLHATGQMAKRLRRELDGAGLVGCISGILTKEAFGVWSRSPGRAPFAFTDVTDAVARESRTLEVVERHRGACRVAACSVLHEKAKAPRGIVIADTGDGTRTVAWTEDRHVTSAMETEDFCGATVDVDGAAFTPRP